MKIVKPRVKCMECGNIKEYEEREFFCDYCDNEINNKNIEQHNMLEISVFFKYNDIDNDDNTINYQFCSWKCVIEKLKTIECDYFISLPELIYEPTKEGLKAKDFLELLK